MAISSLRPARVPSPEGLLTLEDAAAYLKISPGTLKHWIAWRKIEHIKVGKLTRFTKAALDRFVQQQTVAAVEDVR
jgi:excisionase family DNA binding protein